MGLGAIGANGGTARRGLLISFPGTRDYSSGLPLLFPVAQRRPLLTGLLTMSECCLT